MRVWTLNELFRLTHAELCALHREIAGFLAHLPEGSPDRPVALTNLRNIRRVLGRPRLVPS
jgi:hypothetical protein